MQLVARRPMTFAGVTYDPGDAIPDTVWETVGTKKRNIMLASGRVVPAIAPTRRKRKKG